MTTSGDNAQDLFTLIHPGATVRLEKIDTLWTPDVSPTLGMGLITGLSPGSLFTGDDRDCVNISLERVALALKEGSFPGEPLWTCLVSRATLEDHFIHVYPDQDREEDWRKRFELLEL